MLWHTDNLWHHNLLGHHNISIVEYAVTSLHTGDIKAVTLDHPVTLTTTTTNCDIKTCRSIKPYGDIRTRCAAPLCFFCLPSPITWPTASPHSGGDAMHLFPFSVLASPIQPPAVPGAMCSLCRTQPARRGTGPSPRRTTAAPWASSWCMTSPTRSRLAPCRTGEASS